MTSSRRTLPRQLFGLLVLVVMGGWLLTPGQAQEYLRADKLTSTEDGAFRRMYDGRDSINLGDNREILKKAADWYVNRLTWPQYQGKVQDPKDQNTMKDVVNQAFERIWTADRLSSTGSFVDPKQPEQRREFANEFGKLVTENLRKTLNNSEPITRINAARILAQVGKSGYDGTIDVAVEILRNPEPRPANDAVKLYAARAVKEWYWAKDTLGVESLPKEANAKAVSALLAYLAEKANLANAAQLSPEELEGQRYVRREVVRALALSRAPGLMQDNGQLAQTAYWLLRVARADRLNPPPSLSERVEAAIGVCQLDPKLLKETYSTDYAAYQLAWFITDFATYWNNRAGLPSELGAPIAWKVEAARLGVALDQLQRNVAGLPTQGVVTNILSECKKELDLIEKGDNANPDRLRRLLVAEEEQNRPSNKRVYQNVPDSSIQAAANTGAGF
ncbi:MAG: hypothetical protein ACK4RK_08505 [Gemmataceae bacterium]